VVEYIPYHDVIGEFGIFGVSRVRSLDAHVERADVTLVDVIMS